MQPWKTLSRKTILRHSAFLTVEEHIVDLPDGRQIEGWPWIITHSYVNVLARTVDDQYLCFRQTKYAIEGTSFAPVGGHIEPGEDPLVAAKRELLEETGYQAHTWKSLGQYRVNGNHGCGMAHLFFADGAGKAREPQSDDLEEQQLLLLSREEMRAALAAGEFKVLAWALIVSLVLLEQRDEEGGGRGV